MEGIDWLDAVNRKGGKNESNGTVAFISLYGEYNDPVPVVAAVTGGV